MRCGARSATTTPASGKRYALSPGDRDALRASPRTAPARAPRPGRRPHCARRAGGFRALLFHSGVEVARGSDTVLLPAEAREPSRSTLVERRLLRAQQRLGLAAGTVRATVLIETLPAAFEMDEILWELRAALGGAQLRPLGLHLQLHQDPPARSGRGPARPVAGDHDPAMHARLHPAAGAHLPPPRRACHGRHGGADPDQERSRRERGGPGPGDGPTRRAKRATGTTAPGWRIPRWCRSRAKFSRRG